MRYSLKKKDEMKKGETRQKKMKVECDEKRLDK